MELNPSINPVQMCCVY